MNWRDAVFESRSLNSCQDHVDVPVGPRQPRSTSQWLERTARFGAKKVRLALEIYCGFVRRLREKKPSDYQMLDLCWSSFSLFPAVPGWGTGRRWGSDGRGHSRCQCRRLADAGILCILVLGSCLNPDRTGVYPCITYVTGFIWVVWLPT